MSCGYRGWDETQDLMSRFCQTMICLGRRKSDRDSWLGCCIGCASWSQFRIWEKFWDLRRVLERKTVWIHLARHRLQGVRDPASLRIWLWCTKGLWIVDHVSRAVQTSMGHFVWVLGCICWLREDTQRERPGRLTWIHPGASCGGCGWAEILNVVCKWAGSALGYFYPTKWQHHLLK